MSRPPSISAQAADFNREASQISAIAQSAVSELMETARQMMRLKQFTTDSIADSNASNFHISPSLENRVVLVIRSEIDMRIANLRKTVDQMRECYLRVSSVYQSMQSTYPAHDTVLKCESMLRCHRQTLALRAACIDALYDVDSFDSQLGDTLISSWVYEPYMFRDVK